LNFLENASIAGKQAVLAAYVQKAHIGITRLMLAHKSVFTVGKLQVPVALAARVRQDGTCLADRLRAFLHFQEGCATCLPLHSLMNPRVRAYGMVNSM